MLSELVKAVDMKKASLEKELENQKNREGECGENSGKIKRKILAINDHSIREYKALWLSFTPPGPFPCPLCYLFDGKVSDLKTLPRMEDVEPVRCTVCGETFEIPVELLYA